MFNRRKFLTSMTALLSLTMLPGKNSWAMGLGDGALLDMAEAVKFREANPIILVQNRIRPDTDLSLYKRATPDALEFLAKQGYNLFVFFELESLDKRNAEALAGWEAYFFFSNLQHIDVEAAAILASSNNPFSFGGLRVIGVDVARELSKSNGLLHFELDSLSVEVARELARHGDNLGFVLVSPPSDQVLNVLSDHSGFSLDVRWVRPTGSPPREYLSPNQNKKVFVRPDFIEETGEWFENISIVNADLYPDSLVSEDGVITLL
jgi:hypothetical protein